MPFFSSVMPEALWTMRQGVKSLGTACVFRQVGTLTLLHGWSVKAYLWLKCIHVQALLSTHFCRTTHRQCNHTAETNFNHWLEAARLWQAGSQRLTNLNLPSDKTHKHNTPTSLRPEDVWYFFSGVGPHTQGQDGCTMAVSAVVLRWYFKGHIQGLGEEFIACGHQERKNMFRVHLITRFKGSLKK